MLKCKQQEEFLNLQLTRKKSASLDMSGSLNQSSEEGYIDITKLRTPKVIQNKKIKENYNKNDLQSHDINGISNIKMVENDSNSQIRQFDKSIDLNDDQMIPLDIKKTESFTMIINDGELTSLESIKKDQNKDQQINYLAQEKISAPTKLDLQNIQIHRYEYPSPKMIFDSSLVLSPDSICYNNDLSKHNSIEAQKNNNFQLKNNKNQKNEDQNKKEQKQLTTSSQQQSYPLLYKTPNRQQQGLIKKAQYTNPSNNKREITPNMSLKKKDSFEATFNIPNECEDVNHHDPLVEEYTIFKFFHNFDYNEESEYSSDDQGSDRKINSKLSVVKENVANQEQSRIELIKKERKKINSVDNLNLYYQDEEYAQLNQKNTDFIKQQQQMQDNLVIIEDQETYLDRQKYLIKLKDSPVFGQSELITPISRGKRLSVKISPDQEHLLQGLLNALQEDLEANQWTQIETKDNNILCNFYPSQMTTKTELESNENDNQDAWLPKFKVAQQSYLTVHQKKQEYQLYGKNIEFVMVRVNIFLSNSKIKEVFNSIFNDKRYIVLQKQNEIQDIVYWELDSGGHSLIKNRNFVQNRIVKYDYPKENQISILYTSTEDYNNLVDDYLLEEAEQKERMQMLMSNSKKLNKSRFSNYHAQQSLKTKQKQKSAQDLTQYEKKCQAIECIASQKKKLKHLHKEKVRGISLNLQILNQENDGVKLEFISCMNMKGSIPSYFLSHYGGEGIMNWVNHLIYNLNKAKGFQSI